MGYGDVTPTTDAERQYAIFALIVGSLVFGLIVGEIGSLMSALDRQAALVDERMDAVKEYLAWRQIPRDLCIRIRRYYEHYYTQQAVFDESIILGGLNPTLHQELVNVVLKKTLGRAPVIDMLSPEFQLAIFPLLKPLSTNPEEILYNKGNAANELLFLLDGEVDVMSSDDKRPVRRIKAADDKKASEVFLSGEDKTVELVTLPSLGVFGLEVLVGHRRAEKHVSATKCELLTITKSDLETLFLANPLSARRICNAVLQAYFKTIRLHSLSFSLRMGAMPQGRDRAALVLQYAWRRKCDM